MSNAGQTREVRGGRAVARYYMLHGSFLQDLLSTAVWVTQVRERGVCCIRERAQPSGMLHAARAVRLCPAPRQVALCRLLQIVLLLVHQAGGVPLADSSSAFQVGPTRVALSGSRLRQPSLRDPAQSMLPRALACTCIAKTTDKVCLPVCSQAQYVRLVRLLRFAAVLRQLFVLTMGCGNGSLVPGLRFPPALAHALNIFLSSLVLVHFFSCLWWVAVC